MNIRKKLERDVEKLLSRAKTVGIFDKMSVLHARGAERVLHLMSLVELTNFHAVLKQSIKQGRPLKIRKN